MPIRKRLIDKSLTPSNTQPAALASAKEIAGWFNVPEDVFQKVIGFLEAVCSDPGPVITSVEPEFFTDYAISSWYYVSHSPPKRYMGGWMAAIRAVGDGPMVYYLKDRPDMRGLVAHLANGQTDEET